MSRAALEARLAEAQRSGGAAFMPFMTAGLPSPERTVDIFAAMAEAGADAFEVGIPYSDPLMDGPVIQEGNDRVLRSGATLRSGLEVLGRVTEATGRPALAMSYANPVFRIGPHRFARWAAEAGAAGLIVADLPLEESPPVAEAAAAAGIGLVLFAAPTTTEARLSRIAEAGPVFIYGVAEMGVTGEREASSEHPRRLASRIRSLTDVPLVMGVGISSPEQAAAIAPHADGVIVGSALVRRALRSPDPVEDVAEAARRLAQALHSPQTVPNSV